MDLFISYEGQIDFRNESSGVSRIENTIFTPGLHFDLS